MKLFITSLLLIFVINTTYGITTSDLSLSEDDPANINNFSGFDWDYIYSFKGSSGVAVDSNWLLTAGHVADDLADGSLTIMEIPIRQYKLFIIPQILMTTIKARQI